MKVSSVHLKAVDLLLKSITWEMGEDGLKHSFMYISSARESAAFESGVEIYYHTPELIAASLYVRSHGAPYLRALPLGEVSEKMQNFVSENFSVFGDGIFGEFDERPFCDWVSQGAKSELAESISQSVLFAPNYETTLFPLVPIQVKQKFSTETFFLVSADTDDLVQHAEGKSREFLVPSLFPPFEQSGRPAEKPTSWLGVISPDHRAATKTRSSILGAIALTQPQRCIYSFSRRPVFDGRCTISAKSQLEYSFDVKNTPRCAYDICLGPEDEGWLNILSQKVVGTDGIAQRQMKALEYFFRAWFKPPEERFPILYMALDAIFGNQGSATQSVIDGVRRSLGTHIPENRLRAISDIRNSVIHGGAPDVYDTRKYGKYYNKFRADPVRDLSLIVSACVRTEIFHGELKVHADPNAQLLDAALKAGKLPPKIKTNSILGDYV